MPRYKNSTNAQTDRILTEIARYAESSIARSISAYDTAHLCLIDALGCALAALGYPACTKLLGPVAPGTVASSRGESSRHAV